MIEEPTRVVLSRQELYEKLWAVPAASLSKTFGISDVGLAKVCRKHRVPRPPRGHWAKLRNGKRVHKVPLPAIDDPQLDKVVIHRMMIVEKPSVDRTDDAPDRSRTVDVSDRLDCPHALVRQTKDHLRSKPASEDGLVRTGSATCLPVAVAPKNVDRCLRILDALLKSWESLGGSVQVLKDASSNGYSIGLELNGDSLQLRCVEETDRVEVAKTNDPWHSRQWKYKPTGKFTLQIENGVYGHRSRWADGTRQQLEKILGRFIDSALAQLEEKRLNRLDDQCRGRQRAAVKQLREDRQRRIQAEQARRKQLHEDADQWHNAARIREYLAAVKRLLELGRYEATRHEAIKEWIDWASWYADEIDPLIEAPPRPGIRELPANTLVANFEFTRKGNAVVKALGVTNTDELFKVDQDTVRRVAHQYDYWNCWEEICSVLEALGYDVSSRYHFW